MTGCQNSTPQAQVEETTTQAVASTVETSATENTTADTETVTIAGQEYDVNSNEITVFISESDSISELSELKNLKVLHIGGKINSLDFIGEMSELKTLDLRNRNRRALCRG